MDGQNFNNGLDNDQNTEATPVTEAGSEGVTTNAFESAGETVNVNTGNYQDNTSSYSYQSSTDTSSYSYQSDNNTNSGSYNYQDNTNQYYSATTYTDNSETQSAGTPGLAIASLIMGIISIVFCCCWGAGIVFAVPGIFMARSANKKNKTGVGTAGMVCSIIGTVLNACMLLYFAFVFIVGFAEYSSY